MKNHFFTFLKICFAIGLIIYAEHKGIIRWSDLDILWEQKLKLFVSIIIIILVNLNIALRWKRLIHHAQPETSESSFFRFSVVVFISAFFNTFLPGSVAGDLLRFKYANYLHSKLDTKKTLSTSLIDRLGGLLNLIFLAGVGSFAIPFSHGALGYTFLIVQFLSILSLMYFVFLFFPTKISYKYVEKIPFFKSSHKNFLKIMISYQKPLRLNAFLTFINQVFILGMLLWWYLPNLNGILDAIHAISASALGLMLTSVPIAPAGAGVGHILFETLFNYLGLPNGALVFNIYFILVIFVNLIGLIPFLLIKSDSALKKEQKIIL